MPRRYSDPVHYRQAQRPRSAALARQRLGTSRGCPNSQIDPLSHFRFVPHAELAVQVERLDAYESPIRCSGGSRFKRFTPYPSDLERNLDNF